MKKKVLVSASLLMATLLCSCNSTNVTTNSKLPVKNVVTLESQTMGLEGVSNARQLGGYKNKSGKTVKADMLFRSGKLNDATKTDLARIKGYGITKIIDFRTSVEIAAASDPEIEDVQHVWVSVLDETATSSSSAAVASIYATSSDTVQTMINMAKAHVISDDVFEGFVTGDYALAGWRKFFDEVLANKGNPVLWHCTGGKDRAGFATVLFLSALDVDEETILKDFELTNDFNATSIAYMKSEVAKRTNDQEVIDGIQALLGVEPKYMRHTIETAKTKYGSMMNFLRDGVGLTDKEIKQLQKWYLE